MPDEIDIQDQRVAHAVAELRDTGRDDLADLLVDQNQQIERAAADLEAAGVVAGELRADNAELLKRAQAGEQVGGLAAQISKSGPRLGLELRQLLALDVEPGAKQYPTANWLADQLAPAPVE